MADARRGSAVFKSAGGRRPPRRLFRLPATQAILAVDAD
jgi:hypothetical protein